MIYFVGTLISMTALLLQAPCVKGEIVKPWTCPTGWMSYEQGVTCVKKSEKAQTHMNYANDDCKEMGANLIMIDSEEKWTFAKHIMKKSGKRYVLGLQNINGEVKWRTSNGSVPAKNLPKILQNLYWYSDSYYNKNYGQQYNPTSDAISKVDTYYAVDTWYICEKGPDCSPGWFGVKCENQCHCHGQSCDPKDLSGQCLHGCKVGWMGNSCSDPKEDATLKYYCVNSNDLGKYAHVRIDTKGVPYDHIHAVDKYGHYTSWCNDTVVEKNARASVETLKLFMDGDSNNDMRDGKCAGYISESGGYEWRIKLQEKEGFVSLADQQFRIVCSNTSTFDTLSLSAHASIDYGVKEFEHVESQEELVDLNVVDAFDGSPVTKRAIGSSVVLKISFGLGEDNDATGVTPYNCVVSSADGSHRTPILDARGCPLSKSPISMFKKNGSKSLITEPFPLLSFPGAKSIQFDCDYTLCFDNKYCPAGCMQEEEEENERSDLFQWFARRKRSTLEHNKHTKQRVSGSVEVEYPKHRRYRRSAARRN